MFASKDLFLTRPSGYQISRSVRIRQSASAYFSRTPSVTGNQKTWTWSGWIKRGSIAFAGQIFGSNYSAGGFGAAFGNYGGAGVSPEIIGITLYAVGTVTTSAVFRDPSAWYHIVLRFDSTQATQANRFILYVNGVQQTLSSALNVTLNANYNVNLSGAPHSMFGDTGGYDIDGYLAEVNFVDGQYLAPSSFGETNSVTGVWQPIKYTGTYGTNGFYLNFSDNSGVTATTIGKDYSGNGNNWTPNNISVTAGTTYDSMLDVPTLYADGGNGRGNYCVLNFVDKDSNATVNNGNLGMSRAAGAYSSVRATFGASSGKWYWEATLVTSGGSGNDNIGVALSTMALNSYVGNTGSYSYQSNGVKYTSGTSAAYGATFTSGDVIGVAFDADAGTVTFYKNNSSQGVAFTGLTSGPYFPAVSAWGTTWALNFGQQPFTYTPPSGYSALNTQNLPTPTISNGATVMAATTYTGTGATQTISNAVNGVSFQPDLVWVKGRSGATDHAWYDAVRGVQKQLESNNTDAETTETTGLTAFGSTGFTVGALAQMNTSAATYVGWQWNAGGSTVTNTSGTISAQVRANTTAGFSVVTYTGNGSAGATFGHGLGVTPAMIIIKARTATSAEHWFVYQQKLTAVTYYLRLNSTNAQTDGGSSGATSRVTAISSSVITLGPNAEVNENTKTYVAYCFSAVAGYSAFGSYTGNGSADGPFVFTNFRPRWVMIKRTDANENWQMYDTSRNTSNVVGEYLLANSSGAGATITVLDFLSNGFKIRVDGTNPGVNTSGGTYVYMAFCENPFKLSLAR